MIDKIGKQQVKGEKRRGEKEIVHRMKLDSAHGGDDQHEKEEKEKRDRRKETYSPGQWSGLKLFRHHHRDLIAGEQIFVRPGEVPSRSCFVFFRGRKRVIGKVNIFEVGLHLERKVTHLSYILAAKVIAPLIHPLRAIAGC